MMLGLSSRAAPDAPFSELLDICVRRGFAALEIEEGHAHGVGAWRDGLEPDAAARLAAERGIIIVGFRTTHSTSELLEHEDPLESRLARLAAALGTRLVLEAPGRIGPRLDLASALEEEGLPVAVAVSGPECLHEADEAAVRGLDVVWDADPALAGLDTYGSQLLDAHRPRLRGIRLAGGGPETAVNEGTGIGALVRHLALARYDGSLVVSPSSTRYRVAWRTWLGRTGGSGCGGTKPDTTLVELLAPQHGSRAGAGRS